MIVRFENLLAKTSFTRNLSSSDIGVLKQRMLWSVDDTIYWVNKVIEFDSHFNALVVPLYSWECMIKNGDWSIFDTVLTDEAYISRLTDRLCIKHFKTENGISDRSGNAIYLETYKFDAIPPMKYGDLFIFNEIAYVVVSFEIHRRIFGERQIDRVVVVTHDVSKVSSNHAVINGMMENETNPLDQFLGVFGHGR